MIANVDLPLLFCSLYSGYSNEEIINILKDKPIEFYLNKYDKNVNPNSSLLYRAFESNNLNLLNIFYSVFKKDINFKTQLYTKDKKTTLLKQTIESLHKFPDYLFDESFFMDKNGIFHHEKHTEYYESFLEKAFYYGSTPILKYLFLSFADNSYENTFYSFIRNSTHSDEIFEKGLMFFDANLNKEYQFIKNQNLTFNKFKENYYLQMINSEPEILTKTSSNIKNSQHLLKLIKNKEPYFKNLYLKRDEILKRKNKIYTEMGLWNSDFPVGLAAFDKNQEFIELLSDLGYILSDRENEFIEFLKLNKKHKFKF